jgi:hypothetical protein
MTAIKAVFYVSVNLASAFFFLVDSNPSYNKIVYILFLLACLLNSSHTDFPAV